MHKIALESKNSSHIYQLNFHDILIFQQAFNYFNQQKKKVLVWLFLVNLWFAFQTFLQFLKQVNDSLWSYYTKNALKWWSLCYMLPLVLLGVILPACLTPVLDHVTLYRWVVLVWASWIGISCCFIVFITPYSLLIMLFILQNYLNKKYDEQIKKSRFDH